MTRVHGYRPLLLLLLTGVLLAAPHTLQATSTDTLAQVKKARLSSAAWQVYLTTIRGSDSTEAFSAIKEMELIAGQRNASELSTLASLFAGKYCYDKRIWKDQQPLTWFNKSLQSGEYSQSLKASILFAIGTWYFTAERNYPLAFEHLLQAQHITDETGYDEIPDADEVLSSLAVAYFQFGEYDKAIACLHKARQLPVSRPKNQIELHNNLGIAYRDLERYDSATYYFQQALNHATRLGNEAWTGIISGNLGSIYHKLRNYPLALGNLLKDYDLSTRNKQTNSAANAALAIAQIYLELGRMDSAQYMMERGKELAFRVRDPRIYVLLYRNLTRLARARGDIAKALVYTDSMILFRDSVVKANDRATVERARNKIETATHLANIRLLESKKNKQILIRNSMLGITLLLLVIVWQVFRKFRFRQQKNLEILELKQRQANEELKSAQSLLNSYVDTLKQKNQMLEQFAAEIEQLQSIPGSAVQNDKSDILNRLQEVTILTDEDWLEFKKLFSKVHSSFFMQLHEKFPNLTQAETRILALSRLGLSVKEKANMLGISPDSVRRTQQRLNKKIGLTETEILEEAGVS